MRLGMVCYATKQGLGYLAKSFYDSGLVTDVMVYTHPRADLKTNMDWYPPGTLQLHPRRPFVGEKIERWLDDLDAVLFFETPFDWKFPDRCRARGVKTVIIPMYEWFLENPPHKFDLFINPSLLDQDYFPQGIFVPIPAPQGTWQQRTTAQRYLHNAGHIGCRGHKGTLELIKALEYVESDLSLTVRCQESRAFKQLLGKLPKSVVEDKRLHITVGDVPYEKLFSEYDVYVAPEKFNGLSLPLQEAFAAGMMVMTTDRYPANTWLPTDCLIPGLGTSKARTQGGHLEFHEVTVDPRTIARVMDIWYGRDISQHSLAGLEYATNNSWKELKPRYVEAIEGILR